MFKGVKKDEAKSVNTSLHLLKKDEAKSVNTSFKKR